MMAGKFGIPGNSMRNKFIPIALLATAIFAGTSSADEEKMTKGEKRLAKIEAKYQPTGVVKSCIRIRSLGRSSVIDDQTIFFEGRGRKAYFNRLPRKCSRLVAEERFSYSTTIGQLCKHEIITILDSMGSAWNSCGLGEFEEWEKIPKEKKDQPK